MGYYVGEKIRIKDDLHELGMNGCFENNCGYDPDMQMYAGKTATIVEIRTNSYKIDIDGGKWYWTDDMIDQNFENKKEERPVVEHNAINAINKADILANLYSTLELCEIYHPTDEGLNAVYDKWAKEKGEGDVWEGNSVLDILSKHPDYVPEKGYIVKKNEYDRGIDIVVIMDVLSKISYMLGNPFSNGIMTEIKLRPFTYREILEGYYTFRSIYETLKDNPRFLYIGMTAKESKMELDKWEERKESVENNYIVYSERCYSQDERKKIHVLQDLINNIYSWVGSKVDSLSEEELMDPLLIDNDVVKMIEDSELGIRGIRSGQKFNKVIVKILTETGIKDKWVNYNKETARLGDASSPTKFTRFTIISANPVDYYRMSFGSSWSSCQTIDKEGHYDPSDGGENYEGMHASGTSSYMGDPSSIIMYTVDKSYEGSDYEMQPKINRCMFHLGERKFVMGRVYPQGTDGEAEVYKQWRQIFQQVIAECMDVTNYWKTSKDNGEKERQYITKGTHYPDYIYGYCDIAGWSYLKPDTDAVPSSKRIVIGSTPVCPSCGCEHWGDDNIECDDCKEGGTRRCADCGCRYDEDDMHYIDGEWYCEDCCFYCAYHEEWEVGENYYIDGYGDVCRDALDYSGDFRECDNCGEYFYDDGNHVEAEDGSFFCCEQCAESAEYQWCNEDGWYPINETHYCERCGVTVHDSNWDDDLEMCNVCAEELEAEEDNNNEEVA